MRTSNRRAWGGAECAPSLGEGNVVFVHVLSVSSLKGGVGKTTVTLGLASAAFARGVRTLVVDLDPQSDVSTGMDIQVAGRLNIADVLANPKEKVVRQAITSSGWAKVHPGTIDAVSYTHLTLPTKA